MPTKTAAPPAAPQIAGAGNPRAIAEITTIYRGTATIVEPSPDDPTLNIYESVGCEHRHPTPGEAEQCARKLGDRVAANKNRKRAEAAAGVDCEILAWSSSPEGSRAPVYFKACRGHGLADFHPRMTEADAVAADWACPFAADGEAKG